MNDGDQHPPQAGRSAHPPGQLAQEPGEREFEDFNPTIKDALLPRWLHLGLLWIVGLGTIATLTLAGAWVVQQTKADNALAMVAMSSRVAPLSRPQVPLGEDGGARATQAVPTGALTEPAPQTKPAAIAMPGDPARARPAGNSEVTAKPAAAPRPAAPLAKKKRPRPKNAAALARRKAALAQRRRDASSIARLNAAVAQCRAQARAPGECNIRACDVLGSAHPACR